MIEYIITFGVPLLTIKATKLTGEKYAWINRKLIHLSSLPGIYFFYKGMLNPWVVGIGLIILATVQFVNHVRNRELSWYQMRNNYGEVWWCLLAGVIVLTVGRSTIGIATLLTMAISDSVTGIMRFIYFRMKGFDVKKRKHWIGSIGFFILTVGIFYTLGFALSFSTLCSVLLMLSEYQGIIDDNIAIPLTGIVLSAVV